MFAIYRCSCAEFLRVTTSSGPGTTSIGLISDESVKSHNVVEVAEPVLDESIYFVNQRLHRVREQVTPRRKRWSSGYFSNLDCA